MMKKYKIIIRFSCIIINDYTWGDCEILQNYFKVWNPITHSIFYKYIEYNETKKTLILPRGIDIAFIEDLFEVKAFYETDKDNYSRTNETGILLKYPPRDEKQMETMNFLLGRDKYSYVKRYSQLLIALNTGVGKTYLGIAYISYMNLKSVIITSSIEWLKQWQTKFLEHTNILPKEICFISGSSMVFSLLKKSRDEIDRKKIYLISHATILSLANNHGWDKLDELFKHLGIGVKIFDEAHLNFDNMALIDYHTNISKTLYLSATPARSDERENEIFTLYFKNIPKIQLFNPDSDPRTNYIAIRYHSGLKAQEISACINKHGFSKVNYCDQVILKENFDHLMRVIMNIISNIPGQKLLFLSTNKSIKILYEWIESNYPEYHNCVGIYTSINPNKQDALKYPIILTTSSSAGAATDIKGLSCSIQLLEPTKSEIQNRQRLGRTRGYNTFYIDIIDDDCAITKKYYISNFPMFEKYALSTKEIRLKTKDLINQSYHIMENRMNKGISPFIKL